MKNNTLNIDNCGVTELSISEQKNIEGGIAPILAGLAVVGMCAGGLLIGAAVGYGTYKLVKWAVS